MIFFLKASVSLGFFYILFSKFSLIEILSILNKSHFLILTLSLLILIVQVLLANIRWKMFLKFKEIHISLKQALKIFWIGLFFNQILPSTVGGDAVRAYCLIQKGNKIGVTTISILLDRMFGLIGLLILLLIIIPFSLYLIPKVASILQIYLLITIITIFITTIFFMDFLIKNFLRFKDIQIISKLAKDGRVFLKNIKLGLPIISLSIFIHLLTVISIGCIALALNIIISWKSLFIIIPIISLLVFLPISISGWGLREGIMVLGLGFTGVPGTEALTLSLTYGFFLLITALPGIIFWITNTNNKFIKDEIFKT